MKNSIKSSEFILTISVMVLMAVNGTQFINIPWETIQWFIAGMGLYTVGAVARKIGNGVLQGKVAKANAEVIINKENKNEVSG